MNFCSRKIFIIYVLNFLLFVLLFQNIISLEKEDEDFILPYEYDLREEYKDCKSLRDIRDQYRCGGCWAFTVAEVISDRICIKSKGKEQPIISENELITCCNFCFNETSLKKGCGGGYVSSAYLYWIYFGLPTEECKPFHRYYTEKEYIAGNLKCLPRCENGNRKPTRYYGSNIDFIFKNENEKTDINIIKRDEKKIMNEIYEHGSVSASFKIYGNDISNDFDEFFIKNGNEIYGSTPENELKKKYGNYTGHAIKIIGWGSYKGMKYWLCANSWGKYWGNNGFFKFKRGENYLGIESGVIFGYLDSNSIFRSKESMVVYEDNFFNFQNFKEDFM